MGVTRQNGHRTIPESVSVAAVVVACVAAIAACIAMTSCGITRANEDRAQMAMSRLARYVAETQTAMSNDFDDGSTTLSRSLESNSFDGGMPECWFDAGDNDHVTWTSDVFDVRPGDDGESSFVGSVTWTCRGRDGSLLAVAHGELRDDADDGDDTRDVRYGNVSIDVSDDGRDVLSGR